MENNNQISTTNFLVQISRAEVQSDDKRGAIMTDETTFVNKYSLVKGAARRARQLQSGAPPLINAKSSKACRVAQDEIEQGFVKFMLPKQPEPHLH
ncbi:DNA-directed RNA polymerase subunit omega [Edaphobacter sp. HDX4]|uniref:DNA-directed RNA polymerase subunit omega n=1 Tax=Edaphobacter sp. HDX4 TaxID=2794064 RepID=UPI002FE5FB9D